MNAAACLNGLNGAIFKCQIEANIIIHREFRCRKLFLFLLLLLNWIGSAFCLDLSRRILIWCTNKVKIIEWRVFFVFVSVFSSDRQQLFDILILIFWLFANDIPSIRQVSWSTKITYKWLLLCVYIYVVYMCSIFLIEPFSSRAIDNFTI